MKKYLAPLFGIMVAWILLQFVNLIIRYHREGIIDFADMKDWKPFAAVAVVFLIYTFIKELKSKHK